MRSDTLLTTSFETAPFQGIDRAAKRRPISVLVKEDALYMTPAGESTWRLPPSEIMDWHFEERWALFVHSGGECVIQLEPAEVDTLRRQFNLLRLRVSLEGQRGDRYIVQCPECELVYDGTVDGEVSFCPECLSMHDGARNLCQERGYLYNFCSDGWFDLLGVDGDRPRSLPEMVEGEGFLSFSRAVRPFKHKIVSHLLWVGLWLLLWWPAARISVPYSHFAGYLLLFLIFVNVTLLGSYVLTLFFKGWLRPFLWKPRWGRLIGRMRRGRVIDGRDHPGFLANLAWVSGDRSYLDRALSLCPTHPALQELSRVFDSRV